MYHGIAKLRSLVSTVLGLRTVLSDVYGRTIDGQVTGTFHPFTVSPIVPGEVSTANLRDGYGHGRTTVNGLITKSKSLLSEIGRSIVDSGSMQM
jgi:hypothetical protein